MDLKINTQTDFIGQDPDRFGSPNLTYLVSGNTRSATAYELALLLYSVNT